MLANRPLGSAPLSSGALQGVATQAVSVTAFGDTDSFQALQANYTVFPGAFADADSFDALAVNYNVTLAALDDADIFANVLANLTASLAAFVDADSFAGFASAYRQSIDALNDADSFEAFHAVRRRLDLSTFGGIYSEDDYRRYRERIEELEALGKLNREEATRLAEEFNADVYAAFYPPEPRPETGPEPESAAKNVTRLIAPKDPLAIKRAFAAATQREQEEDEMVALLLAA